VKQAASAFHLYTQDYDEACPSIWGGSGTCVAGDFSGCSWEWWFGLYPYVKNIQVFYCPERTDGVATNYNAYGRSLGVQRHAGYGYNWGPIGWRGGGLLNTLLRTPTGQTFLTGKSLAEITNPADTLAFGDTYDTPRMTVGIGFAANTWPGTNNGALRHTSGTFNYAFVDGHARAIKVQGGFMVGAYNNRLIMPRDAVMAGKAFCADPSAILTNGGPLPDGTNIPSPIRCGDIGQWIKANYPPCPPGAGPGSNCLFND
jgi:prepilin-type processing-associated H-X9-DG protein